MQCGIGHWLCRALLRAGGAAASLALLALLIGAGAYSLTSSDGPSPVASRLPPAEMTQALTVPRPHPVVIPRARPAVEKEARARIAPAALPEIDVHSLARTLSVADDITYEDPPDLAPSDRTTVSLSFYYCEHTAGTPLGDGGGFCGIMRNGSNVYPGAAACHIAYLGQLFRIEGDPASVIYRCADTGSAVHAHHRDIWFHSSAEGWSWQLGIKNVAVIEILP